MIDVHCSLNNLILALFLALGGLFITLAFKREKPLLLLVAHPMALFTAAAGAAVYLETENVELDQIIDHWFKILNSDYSSLPDILAFSAIPTWCALAFTSSAPSIPKLKSE